MIRSFPFGQTNIVPLQQREGGHGTEKARVKSTLCKIYLLVDSRLINTRLQSPPLTRRSLVRGPRLLGPPR